MPLLPDELLYVGGHVAHISQYYERKRLARIREANLSALIREGVGAMQGL